MQKIGVLFLLLWGLGTSLIHAKGTEAGAMIQNQAVAHYAVSGIEQNLTSNTDSFVVDRIVDLDLSWQDGAAVEVSSGDQKSILTFLLTNLGNGEDRFHLSYEHNATASQFDPLPTPSIYLDSNGNGIFDPGTDTQVSDLNLSADGNATLFVVADIPTTAQPGDRSYDGILAISQSHSDAGADRPAEIDTVVRTQQERDQGIYQIFDYWLESHKSAVVHSDDNQTHTGTRITYTIDLSIGGNAAGKTIDTVLLRDAIPSGTRYVSGSLSLDAVALTDVADSDAGIYDGTSVQVAVGILTGTTHRQISFDVRVQ